MFKRPALLYIFIFSVLIFSSIVIVLSIRTLNEFAYLSAIDPSGLSLPYKNQPSSPDTAPPDYTFPRETVESDSPLPEKVKNSFKSTIAIRVSFILNSTEVSRQFPQFSFLAMSSHPIESGGTGFMEAPGIFISARHVLLAVMNDLRHNGLSFEIDRNGLPTSKLYSYVFYGTADVNGKKINFPMELVGMGDISKFQDVIVLKAKGAYPPINPLEFEENVDLNEWVYSAGRIPILAPLDTFGMTGKDVLMDFINYNFDGAVKAILTDMPANKNGGPTKIYRIKSNLESGFSGGPVFNKEGKAIGLTMSRTSSFSFALSAKDIKLFLKKLKDSNVIK